jgi:hypothetical protein
VALSKDQDGGYSDWSCSSAAVTKADTRLYSVSQNATACFEKQLSVSLQYHYSFLPSPLPMPGPSVDPGQRLEGNRGDLESVRNVTRGSLMETLGTPYQSLSQKRVSPRPTLFDASSMSPGLSAMMNLNLKRPRLAQLVVVSSRPITRRQVNQRSTIHELLLALPPNNNYLVIIHITIPATKHRPIFRNAQKANDRVQPIKWDTDPHVRHCLNGGGHILSLVAAKRGQSCSNKTTSYESDLAIIQSSIWHQSNIRCSTRDHPMMSAQRMVSPGSL